MTLDSNIGAEGVRERESHSAGRRALSAGLWCSFVFLAGLLVFGIVHEKLFAQSVWTGRGLERLLKLAVVYSIAALLTWLWRPAWLLRGALGLGALYAVASVGFGPVTAAVFLAAGLVALGDLTLSSLGWRRADVLVREGAVLSFLCGTGVLCFAVSICAHFPVNYSGVYIAGFALSIAANWRGLCYYIDGARRRSIRRVTGTEFAGGCLLGFALLAHFLIVLKPEVGFDALAMHLMVPAWVAAHHSWSFDFHRFVWAVMPLAGDWTYTAAYLLGGEFASRLTNYSHLLATVSTVYCVARSQLSRPASLLVTTGFASIPLVQLETGSLFIENALTAMVTGAVLACERLKRTPHPAYLFAASLFLGTAMSIKFGGIAFAVPLVAIAFSQLRASRVRRTIPPRVVLGCVLAFAAPALLPYVYAWFATRNPFYPFMNNVFCSPYYPPVAFDNALFHSWLSWDSLYQVIFRSHLYLESQDGAAGFQLLFVVPCCVLAIAFWRRRQMHAGAAAAGLLGCLIILRTQPYLRYLYPGLPLLTVGFCSALAVIRRLQPGLYRAMLASLVPIFLMNIYFLPASGWYQREFALWTFFDTSEAHAYQREKAPGRRIVEYLNLTHPGDPVWFLGNEQLAGLIGEPLVANWHEPEFEAEVTMHASSVETLLELVKRRGIRRFIAPLDLKTIARATPTLLSFLAENTTKEFEHGSLALLRLRDDLPKKAVLDSRADPKGWSEWQRNGEVVVVPAGAARVTVSDTLVRAATFDDAVTYTYALEASCPEPNTLLRLQINWHDKAGTFIGTTLEPRSCRADWETYTKEMKPPPGAVSGVIIIGGHGAAPVWVKRAAISY